MTNLQLHQYLPTGWTVDVYSDRLVITVTHPSRETAAEFAEAFHEGANQLLLKTSKNLGVPVFLFWEGCPDPIKVKPTPHSKPR